MWVGVRVNLWEEGSGDDIWYGLLMIYGVVGG